MHKFLQILLYLILFILLLIDMASAAFIEPLPVLEFVAQLLGKDVLSRPLSDSDRVKVLVVIWSCVFFTPKSPFDTSLLFLSII